MSRWAHEHPDGPDVEDFYGDWQEMAETRTVETEPLPVSVFLARLWPELEQRRRDFDQEGE